MKVLINAASANMGGALTYIRSFLRELPSLVGDDRFVVVVPAATLGQLERIVDRRIVTLLAYPFQSGGVLRRIAFANWTVPRLAREHEADVLFSSTGFGTLRSPCPQVLLVRNPVYFCPTYQKKHMGLGRSYHLVRARRWMSLLSIRAANVVLFPTDAMRSMVRVHMPLAKIRTKVLHYGFAPDTFFQNDAQKPEIADRMERWKDAGYQVLLNVSHYAIHKNFETLLEALPSVIASGIKVKCVCTISNDLLENSSMYANAYESLIRRARQLGLSDVFICAGHFDHAQLNYLYQKADAFVFPSFTESFGHPLVEAMACGLPIVASGMPVNQELCGEAAAYFDTFNPNSCARAIEATLKNAHQREAMIECGLKRAETFSWHSYTASLLDVFRELNRPPLSRERAGKPRIRRSC